MFRVDPFQKGLCIRVSNNTKLKKTKQKTKTNLPHRIWRTFNQLQEGVHANISRGTAFPRIFYVRPSRQKLRSVALPRSLIRVFVVHIKKYCMLGFSKCTQRRFLSDCANGQTDLNLYWAHMSDDTCSYG